MYRLENGSLNRRVKTGTTLYGNSILILRSKIVENEPCSKNSNFTIPVKTTVKILVNNSILIQTFSKSDSKTHGGDYFTTYSRTKNKQFVSHDLTDFNNGTYLANPICKIDETYQVFITLERTAEQISFYRSLFNSYSSVRSKFYVNSYNTKVFCDLLPYDPDLVKIEKNDVTLFCERRVKVDRTRVHTIDDNDVLSRIIDDDFDEDHGFYQEPVYLGKVENLQTPQPVAEFSRNKDSLPTCNFENSGLNLNGEIFENVVIDKLANKLVLFLDGDSISRHVTQRLTDILTDKKYSKTTTFQREIAKFPNLTVSKCGEYTIIKIIQLTRDNFSM